MNESDTPGPETEPPRDRLSRLSEASLRINESLDFDKVLRGVLAAASDLTRPRYGRWWPYRRPGWSKDPGGLTVRWRVDPGDAHLDGEGAPQRRRNSRTGSAAVRSRFRRATLGPRTSRASTFAHSRRRRPDSRRDSRAIPTCRVSQCLRTTSRNSLASLGFRPAELVVLTNRHVHDGPRALDHFRAV